MSETCNNDDLWLGTLPRWMFSNPEAHYGPDCDWDPILRSLRKAIEWLIQEHSDVLNVWFEGDEVCIELHPREAGDQSVVDRIEKELGIQFEAVSMRGDRVTAWKGRPYPNSMVFNQPILAANAYWDLLLDSRTRFFSRPQFYFVPLRDPHPDLAVTDCHIPSEFPIPRSRIETDVRDRHGQDVTFYSVRVSDLEQLFSRGPFGPPPEYDWLPIITNAPLSRANILTVEN